MLPHDLKHYRARRRYDEITDWLAAGAAILAGVAVVYIAALLVLALH